MTMNKSTKKNTRSRYLGRERKIERHMEERKKIGFPKIFDLQRKMHLSLSPNPFRLLEDPG